MIYWIYTRLGQAGQSRAPLSRHRYVAARKAETFHMTEKVAYGEKCRSQIRNAKSIQYMGNGPHEFAGSRPILSLTAFRSRCLQPRYRSVVWTLTWPSRNWICSSSPPAS